MNRRGASALFAAVLGVILAAAPARAQRNEAYISYTWSQPLGDLKDYVDNDSWVGMSFEGMRKIGDRSSIGFLTGWNTFYVRTKELIPIEGGAIHGDQYRNVNSFPIMGQLIYKLSDNLRGGPYLGLGLGVYYLHQIMDIGISTYSTDNWIFGLAPHVGYRFPVGYNTTGRLDVRYNYPFDAGDFIGGSSASMQYLSVSIGIGQAH